VGFEKKNGQLTHSRPALVQFQYTTGLQVLSTTLKDSPFWTLHPIYCSDVYIADVVIRAPSNSPNTDGIDIDSTTDVLIERVDISNGDDMIAIKSGMNMPGILFGRPSENIIIQNSVFANGHGITIGSETSGGIRNVTFINLVVSNAIVGPHIKTSRGRGAIIEQIVYKNITLSGCNSHVMDVAMNYDKIPVPGNKTTTPILRDVLFEDIIADCAVPGSFDCLPESPCTGFQLQDVHVSHSTKTFTCQYITGTSTDVTPPSCINPAIARQIRYSDVSIL